MYTYIYIYMYIYMYTSRFIYTNKSVVRKKLNAT